jgi:hypothetical protein
MVMVRFYYLFGFLSLVLLIVLITCAEISIALTYFQLTSEDLSSHFLVDFLVFFGFSGPGISDFGKPPPVVVRWRRTTDGGGPPSQPAEARGFTSSCIP